MVIYDFCKTIVNNNSLDDFIYYILKSESFYFRILIYNLINSKLMKIFLKLNLISEVKKKDLKLQLIKDIDLESMHSYSRCYALYLYKNNKNELVISELKQDLNKTKVVVISAGLNCYIKEFMKIIDEKVIVISNDLKFHNEICLGSLKEKDCYGDEKVVQFNKLFGGSVVEKTYSDCMSDTPIFKLANKKFLVRQNEIKEIFI